MGTALEYPFKALNTAEPVSLLDGLEAVRMPLPFALDHVNCWRLDGGKVQIDTAVATPGNMALWDKLLRGTFPESLLLTHHHPDHSGLAAWFESAGSRVMMHAQEHAYGNTILAVPDRVQDLAFADWFKVNGIESYNEHALFAFAHGYGTFVHEKRLPEAFQALDAGQQLLLGEWRFEVRVGQGHSPAMLMLHAPERKLLIVADQVLPAISPNVSLLLDELVDPSADPLAEFLNSLDALRDIPQDTLILPSHGMPFIGLHTRIDELIAHHVDRLSRLIDRIDHPMSAGELIPALFREGMDEHQQAFALGETLAHLRYLVLRGELIRFNENGRWVHQRPS